MTPYKTKYALERGCLRKRRYKTEADADRSIVALTAQKPQSGAGMKSYQCSNCGFWHKGSRKDNTKDRKEFEGFMSSVLHVKKYKPEEE